MPHKDLKTVITVTNDIEDTVCIFDLKYLNTYILICLDHFDYTLFYHAFQSYGCICVILCEVKNVLFG